MAEYTREQHVEVAVNCDDVTHTLYLWQIFVEDFRENSSERGFQGLLHGPALWKIQGCGAARDDLSSTVFFHFSLYCQ